MYISLLTQIKNAQSVGKEKIKFPYSTMDEKILEILSANKFIIGFEKKGKAPKRYFEVSLLYKRGGGAISGTKLVSKPSRRVYRKKDGLRVVRQGYGVSVVSTSSGIMTGKEAKQKGVGGQILFEIW